LRAALVAAGEHLNGVDLGGVGDAAAELRETKLAKSKRGQRREGRRTLVVELTRARMNNVRLPSCLSGRESGADDGARRGDEAKPGAVGRPGADGGADAGGQKITEGGAAGTREGGEGVDASAGWVGAGRAAEIVREAARGGHHEIHTGDGV